MNILTIAYSGEGTTDERFLANIILRTFEDVLIEAKSEIEIHDPVYIYKEGPNAIAKIVNAAEQAEGFHVLCIHVDADYENDNRAFEERINSGFNAVEASNNAICKNLIAIVPIQMTEAWMLSDIDVFKDEIGTEKSNLELGLPVRVNHIERISDPKETINNAIRIAFANYSSRRNVPRIGEIYIPLSQKIKMDNLKNLPSFLKFREAVKQSLVKLNYLQI
jgi:Domain of unknown function (DUF4276)